MIRVICPYCGAPVLLLVSLEEREEVTCPSCKRPFTPDEEEWLDPEDE